MSSRRSHVYPFSAIVGQEDVKLALILNAIDPLVGGVLIRGERGTAKSTAVRGLGRVLPEIDVVAECRFGCDPADPGSWCADCRKRRESGQLPKARRHVTIVDLPVSATEDRLVGTLDLEHVLKHGERRFDAGLLADAHRGILYVDEVNLLADHLVDTLLDVAAMGVNTVQREGVSVSHPARFILVGTMNPEEGDLRPQLLDRFGLCVDVRGAREPHTRVEIMKRRRAFDDDPTDFARAWVDAEDQMKVAIKHSRLRAASVTVSDELLFGISSICAAAGVDGHRADLTMARAAAALAAYENRSEATESDVTRVAPMVLAHRLHNLTPEDSHSMEARLASILSSAGEGDAESSDGKGEQSPGASDSPLTATISAVRTTAAEESIPVAAPVDMGLQMDRVKRTMNGRRHETVAGDGRGRYTRAEASAPGSTSDIAIDATVRNAAISQSGRTGDLAINITPEDLRTKVRTRKVGATIVFCVDASGSMDAGSRMAAAKSAVLDLLVDAYQRRDRVGVVSFRGNEAQVVLAPTASVELAQLKMRDLQTGGSTPLAAGMLRGLELLENEMRRTSQILPWLVLVTDGRANVGLSGGLGSEDARAVAARVRASKVHALVLDTGNGSRAVSGAREIAEAAGAEYIRLQTMDGASIAATVRERLAKGW